MTDDIMSHLNTLPEIKATVLQAAEGQNGHRLRADERKIKVSVKDQAGQKSYLYFEKCEDRDVAAGKPALEGTQS